MKIKLLFTLILWCFAFSGMLSAQYEIETRPRYAPRSEKHRNVYDENGLKQGLWKYYTRDRILYSEITFLNDRRHGPYVRHHTANGVIIEESNYFNGKKDGEYRKYKYTGSLMVEGYYLNNRKTGKWTTYYSVNGEKRSEGEYENSKRTGNWSYYSSKGKLKLQGEYKDGLKDGIWTTYNSAGTVVEQLRFDKGVVAETIKTKETVNVAQNN